LYFLFSKYIFKKKTGASYLNPKEKRQNIKRLPEKKETNC
jgi:hypothetical protein